MRKNQFDNTKKETSFENLTKAKAMAATLFKVAVPTGEMIFGVHDLVFGEEDEEERGQIVEDLVASYGAAIELIGVSPSADDVFGVYDREFTDFFEDDEE